MKEFKDEAVQLVVNGGLGLTEAARRLSISVKTLANWVAVAKHSTPVKVRTVEAQQPRQRAAGSGDQSGACVHPAELRYGPERSQMSTTGCSLMEMASTIDDRAHSLGT